MDKSAIFSASKKAGSKMVIEEWGGLEVLVKPVSVQQSLALGRAAKEGKEESAFVDAFIDCVRDPETTERVFGPDDREQIMELEGSVVTRIVNRAAGIDTEKAVKN